MSKKTYKTLETLTKINDYIWMLEYKDDYALDKILNAGKKNIFGVLKLLKKEISSSIKLNTLYNGSACSTFNAITPDGKFIFGRNFDYKESQCTVTWTNPKNGYKSISVSDNTFMLYGHYINKLDKIKRPLRILAAPYTSMDGINECGLACAVLEIKSKSTKQRTGKKPITTVVAIRAILDKCKNVDEAIKLLESYDMNDLLLLNYHYQFADADGNTAIVEYVNNKINIIRNDNKNKYLNLTNFFITPGADNRKGKGKNRFEKIKSKLELNKGILTEKEAMQLLSSCTMKYHHRWMPHMVITLWSNVFNCSDKSMLLCAGMDYNTMYKFSVNNPGTFEKIDKTGIKLEILNEEQE